MMEIRDRERVEVLVVLHTSAAIAPVRRIRLDGMVGYW